MEFLEKLYSQEYFAPILFGIILVLIITFIIVFIMALKDAKKNQANIEMSESFDSTPKTEEEASVMPIEANPTLENNEVAYTPEVHEIKKEEDPVVSNVEPTSNIFEEVHVDIPEAIAPVEENNAEVELEQSLEDTIKVEESPVSSAEEVAQAENELDEIAATLLAEYKKEPESVEVSMPKPEEVELPKQEKKDQFSSVFVTPNTLQNEVKESSIPDIADIPLPQPVRVVSQSTIIDSSKSNEQVDINNINAEEYSIKR